MHLVHEACTKTMRIQSEVQSEVGLSHSQLEEVGNKVPAKPDVREARGKDNVLQASWHETFMPTAENRFACYSSCSF